MLVLLACGSSHDPPAEPADAGSAADATTPSDGGDATTDAGSTDGGPGDPCAPLLERFDRWLSEHTACSDTRPCERLGEPAIPQDHDFFCNRVGTAPDAEIEELTEMWNRLGCGDASTCGGLPGRPVCVAGTCALDDSTGRCLACDWETPDPHCTEDGRNAFTPCAARECLWSEPATPGWCPDSAACLARDGSCEETTYDQQPCPDGTRYPFPERPDVECANGNVRNYCCTPWSEGCTFAAGAWQLSVDPRTCTTGPETCVGFGAPSGCVVTGATLGPIPARLPFWKDVEVAVVLEWGNTARIEGSDTSTGHTFHCEGPISHERAFPEEWSCTSCAGADCTTCTALLAAYCSR
jgi:hypothetical protein